MSNMFICGSWGCEVVSINDEAMEIAQKLCDDWAQVTHFRTGEFPSLKEQAQYMTEAYNRAAWKKAEAGATAKDAKC